MWRFRNAVGHADTDAKEPKLLAYADPPYPGLAHYYADQPEFDGEIDHVALLSRLEHYDGWALSTSARALPTVLASCQPGVRVASWVRGSRSTYARTPVSSWEPVIFKTSRGEISRQIDDSLVYTARPRLTDPHRVIGQKPATFWRWIFELLQARRLDSFEDMFPASGGGDLAWGIYTSRGARVRIPDRA